MNGRSSVPPHRFTLHSLVGNSRASPQRAFRPYSPATIPSDHPVVFRSCQAAQYQRALSRPYLALATSLRPSSSIRVPWRPQYPLGDQGHRFFVFDPQARLVSGVSPAKAATALHDMGKAVDACVSLVQLTGRLHRRGLATPATTAGLRLLFAMAAAGEAEAALTAVVRLAKTWETESGAPVSSNEIEWALAELLWSEVLRSRPRGVSRQRTSELVGRAVGLTRSAARNTRSFLLLLIALHAKSVPHHDGQPDATGSRGRDYLRSALSGSGARNAPPLAAVVRTLGKAGIPGPPPMVLVA